MLTFQERMERAKNAGKLTNADLSVWFDRPYATVRGWLKGREPWGPHGEESRRLLKLLEQAIGQRRGFPVPVYLSPAGRRRHMTKVRHDLNGGISQAHTAG